MKFRPFNLSKAAATFAALLQFSVLPERNFCTQGNDKTLI